MMLEQVEVNKTTMRNDIDYMQGKIDYLLETMLSMAWKERNVEIDVDVRRISSQVGTSSLHIPRVTNPGGGFVRPEGIHIPIPILVGNAGIQNHFFTSIRHGFVFDDEDIFDCLHR